MCSRWMYSSTCTYSIQCVFHCFAYLIRHTTLVNSKYSSNETKQKIIWWTTITKALLFFLQVNHITANDTVARLEFVLLLLLYSIYFIFQLFPLLSLFFDPTKWEHIYGCFSLFNGAENYYNGFHKFFLSFLKQLCCSYVNFCG